MGDSDSSSPGEGGSKGGGGGKEGASAAAGGVKLLLGKGKVAVAVQEGPGRWDPASSSDWDKERYTAEALVRIKR